MILIAGALLMAGTAATLVAGRLRVPGLVLFLGLGMLIGSDGLGWIEFDNMELARTIGVIALALILFEGGLAAGWPEIRPVFGAGLSLATAGTILTALVTGLAAHLLLDLTLLEGLLLGSIASTTDSAAIFSVLRQSGLRRRLARTLEAESGMNDPVAVLLVLGFIEWIRRDDWGLPNMVGLFAGQLAIGAAVGLAVGWLAVAGIRRVRFATTGLYPVASIAAAAIAFGGAEVLTGSGFLAVYLTGLALGSGRIPARRTVGDFHAGIAWVSQIALFFTLGLLVFPTELGGVAGEGLLIAGVLMLVARPAASLLATVGWRYSPRESLLIGWAGLRGALPVVLATFPVIDGVPHAGEFFNIVFFLVITSAVIQGATFEPLADALGLTTSEPALPRPLHEVARIRRLGGEVLEFPVGADDAIAGHVVNELQLPREAIVSLIVRRDQALPPRGSTVIEPGDRLHILVREAVSEQASDLFERWRSGPIGEPEPPAPRPTGHAAIFTVRRPRPDDGDPADPGAIGGVPVLRRLRTRRDRPGALVQLEDGRFAVTGPDSVAVGGSRQLFRHCRKRIGDAEDYQERAWWQRVAGVLAQRAMR